MRRQNVQSANELNMDGVKFIIDKFTSGFKGMYYENPV